MPPGRLSDAAHVEVGSCFPCYGDQKCRNIHQAFYSSVSGYCHEACFFTPISTSAYPERDPLCKQCHIVLSSPATAKNGEHLKNNFSSTNTDAQLPHSSTKIISLSGGCVGGFAALHPAPVVDADLTRQPQVQRAIVEASCLSETRGRVNLQVSHGLVWRSRKNGDGGEQFRLRHVIPKGGDSTMRRPICVLCAKDYDPSAMYVRCERCLSKSTFTSSSVQMEILILQS